MCATLSKCGARASFYASRAILALVPSSISIAIDPASQLSPNNSLHHRLVSTSPTLRSIEKQILTHRTQWSEPRHVSGLPETNEPVGWLHFSLRSQVRPSPSPFHGPTAAIPVIYTHSSLQDAASGQYCWFPAQEPEADVCPSAPTPHRTVALLTAGLL